MSNVENAASSSALPGVESIAYLARRIASERHPTASPARVASERAREVIL